MKPTTILASLALLVCSTPLFAAEPATGRQPNVVVIFIDDLGYADIGPFGATKQKTPHLDRMASEGMKLTSFYAAPVCSVSRAQMMTGCYGVRVSVPGVFSPASKFGLHPRETTVAERLKSLGYATMCIGKWHLGDHPDFLPTRQGFDHYLGIPYSNDMQRTSTETKQRVVPLVRDEKVQELLTDEQQSRIVETYTTEAVKFIREHQDSPFFLYLPHTAVHTPIWPGDAFRGKSANGRFGDWVEEVDWSVGQVLDTLRESKLDRNTLVVFTSDNGPWLIKGPDGGSALPLRGGKGSTWEGGVRVPTVAWWPGRIAPGSVCDAVAGTIDILPTAVAVAGGTVPAEPVIDGRDLSPLLFGRSRESAREAHYYFSGYNLQAVRQGPWKLSLAPQPEVSGLADDAKINPRLYNLDQEIGERTNLAAKHPELVAKLQALAEKMNASIGGENPPDRRPAGEVANPQTLYPSEAPPANNSKKSAKKGAVGKAIDLSRLQVGDEVDSESIPQVGAKPITITCQVKTAARDGVILAHGGTAVGYAIHLRGGQLVFTIRDQEMERHLDVGFPPSGDSHRVSVSVDQEGTARLQVDDQPAASKVGFGFVRRQPQEDFCVGHDNGRPLTTYSTNSPFAGSVTDLRITSP